MPKFNVTVIANISPAVQESEVSLYQQRLSLGHYYAGNDGKESIHGVSI